MEQIFLIITSKPETIKEITMQKLKLPIQRKKQINDKRHTEKHITDNI